MRILVAQFHQLRVRRLRIPERDQRARFRDSRVLLYRRFGTSRDQPRRDRRGFRVAPELQQSVRQHHLAGIDRHALRVGLDETIECICRAVQIVLPMLRQREIVERVVAERGKIVGREFETIDRARIVVILVRAIAVEERGLSVGGRPIGSGYWSGRQRRRTFVPAAQLATMPPPNPPAPAPRRIRQAQHTTPRDAPPHHHLVFI